MAKLTERPEKVLEMFKANGRKNLGEIKGFKRSDFKNREFTLRLTELYIDYLVAGAYDVMLFTESPWYAKEVADAASQCIFWRIENDYYADGKSAKADTTKVTKMIESMVELRLEYMREASKIKASIRQPLKDLKEEYRAKVLGD